MRSGPRYEWAKDKEGTMFRTLISLALLILLIRWKWDELRALVLRYVDLDWDYEIWTPEEEDAAAARRPASVVPSGATNGQSVFVTASGTRYHNAGCQSLGEHARAISLAEARSKYQPCGRCKPVA